MSNIHKFIKKHGILGAALAAFFFASLASTQAFGAAGAGGTVSGGGASGDCPITYNYPGYYKVWDTCVGGSWNFYRVDMYFHYDSSDSTIKYDIPNDKVIVPPAGSSGSVSGGTISGCIAENHGDENTGFFKFGLQVYSADYTSSFDDWQVGVLQKGNIKSIFDPPFRLSNQTTIYNWDYVQAKIAAGELEAWIQSLPHGARFTNDAAGALFHKVEELGQNSGLFWDTSPELGWFCAGQLIPDEQGKFGVQASVASDSIPQNQTQFSNGLSDGFDSPKTATPRLTIQSDGTEKTESLNFYHHVAYKGTKELNGQPPTGEFCMDSGSTPLSVLSSLGVTYSPNYDPLCKSYTAKTSDAPYNGVWVSSSPLFQHVVTVNIPKLKAGDAPINFKICEKISTKNATWTVSTKTMAGPTQAEVCVDITVNPPPSSSSSGEVQTRSNVGIGDDPAFETTAKDANGTWENNAKATMSAPSIISTSAQSVVFRFSHQARYTGDIPANTSLTRTLTWTRNGASQPASIAPTVTLISSDNPQNLSGLGPVNHTYTANSANKGQAEDQAGGGDGSCTRKAICRVRTIP